MRVLIILISLLCWPVYADENPPLEAQMTLDRNWGLLIGDVIQAQVVLPVLTDTLDQDSLPQAQKRYGHWLYLKALTSNEKTLDLTFQVINVPRENREVRTPRFTLKTDKGETITVVPTPLQIGSFLLAGEIAETADQVQPDTLLQPVSAQTDWQRFWLALWLLLISGLILLIWQFGLRPGKRLPFANARIALFKLRWFGGKDVDQASRVLHQAFNATAGSVVVHSQLENLFRQAPWLRPLETRISDFYQQSARRFFTPEQDKQKSFEDLENLAKACRARERVA